MDAFLAGIEASAIAQYLRLSRWGYAAVNATHIFGLALLIGAIVPLDLKLLGAWPKIERTVLVRVLVPVAATGLAIAVLAGALMFSTGANAYAALTVFRFKIALIVAGTVSALSLHWRYGLLLNNARQSALRIAACVSILCWTGALVCGRLIAFAD